MRIPTGMTVGWFYGTERAAEAEVFQLNVTHARSSDKTASVPAGGAVHRGTVSSGCEAVAQGLRWKREATDADDAGRLR